MKVKMPLRVTKHPATAPPEKGQGAYLLAVTLGLRRGEICGLSWNDIASAFSSAN